MSKRTIEELEENINKRLKQMEDNYKQMEVNNKSINDTFLSILTYEQIFKLFDECNYNMINYIISNKNGFDINMIINGKTLLFHACDKNNQIMIQLLLSNSTTDVNKTKTKNGSTPLLVACQKGHEEVVRMLLVHATTEVNQAKTDDGATPLFMACQEGHEGVVRLLLEKGADWTVGMRDNGWSPLFVASWAGKAAVVAELLERQACDPATATTSEHLGIPAGSTALSVADLKGHDYVVALLRRL